MRRCLICGASLKGQRRQGAAVPDAAGHLAVRGGVDADRALCGPAFGEVADREPDVGVDGVPATGLALAAVRDRGRADLVRVLRGEPGAGKTHLAVAILREVVWSDREPKPTALFLNVPDWLNALRESYGDGEPPPNPSGYDLVVLDDLGAEDWSSWARDRIYNLVNQREQQRRLVIVTTNHEWQELAGRVGGPTASRLRRLTREVHVDARTDFRERAAA